MVGFDLAEIQQLKRPWNIVLLKCVCFFYSASKFEDKTINQFCSLFMNWQVLIKFCFHVTQFLYSIVQSRAHGILLKGMIDHWFWFWKQWVHSNSSHLVFKIHINGNLLRFLFHQLFYVDVYIVLWRPPNAASEFDQSKSKAVVAFWWCSELFLKISI